MIFLVRFQVKPYLAAYMRARYGEGTPTNTPIRLTHTEPLYSTLHRVTVPYPAHSPHRETGNLCMVVPQPRYGKDPSRYNYVGAAGAQILERQIETQMRAELFDYLMAQHYRKGWELKKALETFIDEHGMEDLVEESTLMRAYQRWRAKRRALVSDR